MRNSHVERHAPDRHACRKCREQSRRHGGRQDDECPPITLSADQSPEGLRQSRNETRAGLIEGMARVSTLDMGYTNFRFSRSERTGSRFVDLSLASRTAGLV